MDGPPVSMLPAPARAALRWTLLLCTAACATPFADPATLAGRGCACGGGSVRREQRAAAVPRPTPQPPRVARPRARDSGLWALGSGQPEDASAGAAPRTTRRARAPPRLPPGGASTFWDRQSAQAPRGAAGGPAAEAEAPTDVLVLGTSQTHSSTVIWLHGKAGDPPRAWLRALAKLNMPWCKFLLPVAASRRGADAMRGEGQGGSASGALLEPTAGWEDGAAEDDESLRGAVQMVHELIDREAELGVLPDKVVVGGFGQGAAVALLASLTYPRQLAGVASFAGYLPAPLLRAGGGALRGGALDVAVVAAYLPVLLCHGSRDAVVPVMTGLGTYKALVALGTRPSFRSVQGVGHGVSREMMGLLRQFLLSNVGPQWPGGLGALAPGDAQRALEGLAVSEILDFLHARNIDTSSCARRSDLVALAQRVVAPRAAAGAAPYARGGWEGFLDNNVPMNPPSFAGERLGGDGIGKAGAGGRVRETFVRETFAVARGVTEDDAREWRRWAETEEQSAASRAFGEWRQRQSGLASVWQGDSMLAEADEACARGDIPRARSLLDSARTAYQMDGAEGMKLVLKVRVYVCTYAPCARTHADLHIRTCT